MVSFFFCFVRFLFVLGRFLLELESSFWFTSWRYIYIYISAAMYLYMYVYVCIYRIVGKLKQVSSITINTQMYMYTSMYVYSWQFLPGVSQLSFSRIYICMYIPHPTRFHLHYTFITIIIYKLNGLEIISRTSCVGYHTHTRTYIIHKTLSN